MISFVMKTLQEGFRKINCYHLFPSGPITPVKGVTSWCLRKSLFV